MDYPIHNNTISMELSILFFKDSQVEILFRKIVFILENSIYHDEMRHKQHFNWVYTVCQHTISPVSRMKMLVVK